MPTIEELMKKNTNVAPLPETDARRSSLEPDRIDLNLYNEAKSEGIDMKGITSNLGLRTALNNKKAEQKGQIIFGIEILGIILVILAVFLWLRRKYK